MITQYEAQGSERSASFTHVLIITYLGFAVVGIVEGALRRTHIPNLSIVGVASLADGTDGFEAPCLGELEVQAPLNAIVLFRHASHRNIRERVDIVEIEVLPFCSILYDGAIGHDVGLKPRVLHLVANLGRVVLLCLQVHHEVVVHLG